MSNNFSSEYCRTGRIRGRKSIHDNNTTTMGGYGVNDYDEIDGNVHSKHPPPVSTSPRNKPLDARRRKSDTPNPTSLQNSNDNGVAKSVPSTLPSYLNYRSWLVEKRHNQSDHSANSFDNRTLSRSHTDRENHMHKTSNSEVYRGRTYDSVSYREDERNDASHTSLNFNLVEDRLFENMRYPEEESNNVLHTSSNLGILEDSICESRRYPENAKAYKSNCTLFYITFVPCIALVVYLFINTSNVKNETIYYRHNLYDAERFLNDINNLGQQYRINNDAILKIQTGISTIFEDDNTGSFIFVYDSRRTDISFTQFDSFVNDVALSSAKYLRNESESVSHTVLESHSMNMETHAELINKYKEDLTNTGVLVVKDIDRVPSILAMAFHYYCDENNPLVKKSAIFFTLDLNRCTQKEITSLHMNIEKCLEKKWDQVPSDNIKPLLSRVVNVIVVVS